MQILMVNAGYRMTNPSFDLLQRHGRGLLGVSVALSANIRERCAGQQMNLSHKRSDEALNMAAVVRGSRRAIIDRNPVLLTPAAQCFRVKLLSVIQMKLSR